jgi:hypothetical protein
VHLSLFFRVLLCTRLSLSVCIPSIPSLHATLALSRFRYTEVSEETIARDLMGKHDGRLVDGVDKVTLPAKAGSIIIFPGVWNQLLRSVGACLQFANSRTCFFLAWHAGVYLNHSHS